MKYVFLTLAGFSAIALSSCNTTIGLGRDMRVLGEGMERKATETYGGEAAGGTGGYDTSSGYDTQAGGAPIY
ncbi:hypothetical protein [Luteolibacter sp. AS25]|uniref:hypothetical protein n=1 Tax=Luteolibacter sp. AS25 TaxID=3135776 RepID=UPI00398AD7D5